MPLLAGFLALALALILVVAAATSLYLERKRLYTVADAAALAAAQSFPLDTVTVEDGRVRLALRDADTERAVREYLAAAPADLPDLALEEATTSDGRSASVTLSASWRPPLASFLLPDGLRLRVTSVARTAFR
ncbi:pilus assembly protein TadG-related protein [Naasia aerilata]|uniref:Putative Flp pilus-assembly TadG-like N-terminal domain-containing protein n=1 Tax=Naasia aerilata TaxID=1162966 RepID=A0ABM8G820_9MICO|nr:pilus assembly protein TadG-related protein [Naasia aerilata]BDZ44329.1 hypothetical protein GCM10025866_02380 [Naasia aerilata]